MNYDYESTTETGYFFDFRESGRILHLKVKHPGDVRPYIAKLPYLESIEFDFGGSAFRASYDKFEQIDQALRDTQFKAFSIKNAKKFDTLPEILNRHKIKSFSIDNCPGLSNLEPIIEDLPYLEYLKLADYSEGYSGSFFSKIPKLKNLIISCKSIDTFEGIEVCQDLEKIEFSYLNNKLIEFSFSNFKNLKHFNLTGMPNLSQLPDLKSNSKIQNINLRNLPKIENKFFDFQVKRELETLNITNVGNKNSEITFSDSFGDCQKLKELHIYEFGLKNLPIKKNTVKKLEKIELNILPNINEIPDVFEEAQALFSFQLNDIPSLKRIPSSIGMLSKMKRLSLSSLNTPKFDIDFSKCNSLEDLFIFNFPNIEILPHSFTQLPRLKNVKISNFPNLKTLPAFGNSNTDLEDLRIENITKAKEIPKSFFELKNLRRLELDGLPTIEIPKGFSKMENLYSLSFNNFKNLKSLPLDIMSAPSISNLQTTGSPFIQSEYLPNNSDFFGKAKKSLPNELLPYFFYSMTNGFENMPLTNEIKVGILKCLNSKSPNARSVIFQQIQKLNPDQKPFSADQIIAGESVIILGKPHSAITPLKKKMKDLGLNPVTKLTDEVRLILVGKSPTIPDNFFDKKRILFKESEIELVSKKLNPQLLQKEEIPKEYIENLRQLLWSNDPNNYAVALELVKTNGLPDLAQDDFLYVAKTCKDKNIKARIRKFLKGKVSEDRVRAISFGGSNFQVGKLGNILSKESMANMYFAHFKTTGEIDISFFWVANEDHPGRKEIFEKHFDTYFKKPHYLQIYPHHSINELNQIFSHTIFKGHLKRLVLNTPLPEMPEDLLIHLETLSDLSIYFNEEVKELPKELYSLKKLSKLTIHARSLNSIPKGIEQLKRLTTLQIYSDQAITISSDFVELKKLKKFHHWGKISNLESIKGKMPLLNI